MKKNFSLFEQLETNLQAVEDIDNCIKISLGPTGKNGIIANKQGNLKILTTGSILLNSLEFSNKSSNIILKLFQQASSKTFSISGDGSTTTILFACQLLKSALTILGNGYNSIIISNGLKRIAFFILEKILEFSIPIATNTQIFGILQTNLGKKLNSNLFLFLKNSISKIGRDGIILIEENISEENEFDLIQGIELDKGFASSYFVTDLKNFEVVFEKPYVLITNIAINSINQIRTIIEYTKQLNRPLIIVTEEINKDVLSTLILNNLQKKIKIVVIKYKTIEFKKDGILDDLAVLTHANYFDSKLKQHVQTNFNITDLGQVEKVIVGKSKTTFIISKFAKLIAQRRINELNRELLNSESEYEKNLFKMRIARLSGQIIKIKIGLSNRYEIDEQRQKIENAFHTIHASLEEGILPGGGSFYLYLKNELANWGQVNLVGEELIANLILSDTLNRPIQNLFENSNTPSEFILIVEKLKELGYPYSYNLLTQKFVHTFEDGLIDCSKSVRGIIWNSISIISTLLTSD